MSYQSCSSWRTLFLPRYQTVMALQKKRNNKKNIDEGEIPLILKDHFNEQLDDQKNRLADAVKVFVNNKKERSSKELFYFSEEEINGARARFEKPFLLHYKDMTWRYLLRAFLFCPFLLLPFSNKASHRFLCSLWLIGILIIQLSVFFGPHLVLIFALTLALITTLLYARAFMKALIFKLYQSNFNMRNEYLYEEKHCSWGCFRRRTLLLIFFLVGVIGVAIASAMVFCASFFLILFMTGTHGNLLALHTFSKVFQSVSFIFKKNLHRTLHHASSANLQKTAKAGAGLPLSFFYGIGMVREIRHPNSSLELCSFAV